MSLQMVIHKESELLFSMKPKVCFCFCFCHMHILAGTKHEGDTCALEDHVTLHLSSVEVLSLFFTICLAGASERLLPGEYLSLSLGFLLQFQSPLWSLPFLAVS